MRKRVAVLLVPVLVLAACGGGDDDSADGGSGDSWCALAQQIDDSSDRYEEAFGEGGATLEEALGEFTSLLDDAKDAAPDEISEAVETAADGIGRFEELLDEVDYNILELDESVFEELEAMGEEMDAATGQIEAYNARECGIPADESADEPVAPVDEADDEMADEDMTDDDMTDDDMTDDDMTDDDMTDDDTADEDTTDDAAGPNEDMTFSGDSNSPWCVANRELDELNDEFQDLFLEEPEVIEAKLTEMLGRYEDVASVAPPELAGDVVVSLATMKQLEAALIAADYDFLDTDLSALDEEGAGQVANDNIEAYNEQVCGIVDDDPDSSDGDDDSGFEAGAGTIRDQAVAELVNTGFTQAEAECLFDNIDFTDPDVGEDPSDMIAVFDKCGMDLARLAELGG